MFFGNALVDQDMKILTKIVKTKTMAAAMAGNNNNNNNSSRQPIL